MGLQKAEYERWIITMKKKMMIFLCLAVMTGSIAACGNEAVNGSDKEKPGTEESRGDIDNRE